MKHNESTFSEKSYNNSLFSLIKVTNDKGYKYNAMLYSLYYEVMLKLCYLFLKLKVDNIILNIT